MVGLVVLVLGGGVGECTEDELECLRQVFFTKNIKINSVVYCISGDPWRAEGGLPNLRAIIPLQTQPKKPGLSRIWKIKRKAIRLNHT